MSCGAAAAGRAAAGAGPGRGPQPAVWRGAAVLHRRWPLPRAGAQLPVDCVLLLGGVAGAAAGLRRMPRGRWRPAIGDRPHRRPPRRLGSLPPRSFSPTVAGCRLGGVPVGCDRWGGERVVGGVLPRINIGTDV